MTLSDQLALCLGSLREHRLRAGLSILGIAIGVGAVILMTSIGEGARVFVAGEFQQFGTNILQVTPGLTETFGIPGALGGTTHKLTIDDAEALRRVPGVEQVVPVVLGQARVASQGRGRSVYVYGVTSGATDLWKVDVRQGSFLPGGDPRRGSAVTALGPRLARELFGERSAVGSFVRVSGWRLRVVGVMAPKGRILGFDMDDCAYVPVATAMSMFDMDELNEVDVTFAHESMTEPVVRGVRAVLEDRHGGREDFTVLTQAAMLEVFDDVLRIVTLGVTAIAAVSLLVGMVGILTVMWISVGERTHEIGLLRALGATVADVRNLFLLEAAALAGLGGAAGLLGGLGLAHLLGALLPGLPISTPLSFAAAAVLASTGTGLVSGIAPARRAALLDPIEALRSE
jgi:putative ABC transport system permease protein